ncbi:hypothetical protein [Pseudaestuariivita rosea]|uniref:hypothetical protein n=1 Tax=Pseudaestuariivita rosea TaxID=2763263 RepID=UPI001ABB0F4D|nr:hypothetical protein [Pseudaestuariivita rosea]
MKRALLISLTLFFTTTAAVQLWAELSTVQFSNANKQTDFSALLSSVPPVPPSVRGRYQILQTCDTALNGPFGQLQSTAWRAQIGQHCLITANNILRQTPQFSFAHLIVASAEADRNNINAARAALQSSQTHAPYQAWLIERRIQLQFEAGHLTKEELEGLLLTARGPSILAARYAADPNIRAVILAVLRQISPQSQKRFLDQIKAHAG